MRTWYPLAILASGLAAYSNSFSVPFIFDDIAVIPENPSIRHLWPIWPALWGPDGMGTAGRPVVNYSFALNYAISGLNVWSYHAANLAIHLAAALALFGIVRRTLGRPPMSEPIQRRSSEFALAISLLWMLHPIQTESVTYLVIRNESLMGMFYLLTLYAFVRGCGSARPRLWFAVSVLSCLLGMGSKEVMATAPLAVLLYDWSFVRESAREMFRRRGVYYSGLFGTWIFLAALILSGPRSQTTGFGLEKLTPLVYARTEAAVIVHYLRLSFWPHPLVFDYFDWPPAADASANIIQCLMILALLAGIALLLLRRSPWAFPCAWFFLILGPSSSLMPIREIAWEYRMYLPLAGVIAAAILGGTALLIHLSARVGISGSGAAQLQIAGCLIIGAAFAVLTFERNKVYISDISVYEDTLKHRPGNFRVHNNLGVALQRQGNLEGGIGHLKQAVALRPDYAEAWNNLGTALEAAADLEGAESAFRKSIEARPQYAQAHAGLGALLRKLRKLDEAENELRQAVAYDIKYSPAFNALGVVLLERGKAADAVAQFRTAVELSPDLLDARRNLALAYVDQGEFEAAVQEYAKVLQAAPRDAVTWNNLGVLDMRMGKRREAEEAFAKAVEINPNYADAQQNLRRARSKLSE
ncbi:tetratricopeptide repeat protein [Candidatus Sumerlaeota bacterium]|nr:tetratricopeptide repeat protein [Candidatus Sumerlaeota bacterium]